MKKTSIKTETLRALFDIAVGSMDFGSGFLDTEEVEYLREVAVLLGVDPLKGTPGEFVSQYPHPYDNSWGDGRCRAVRCNKSADDSIHSVS